MPQLSSFSFLSLVISIFILLFLFIFFIVSNMMISSNNSIVLKGGSLSSLKEFAFNNFF